MGIYSWLRSIADRVKMACVYPDQVIRIGEGLEEGAEISDEIRAKWKAESDRQVKGLMAQKERELMAQKAQQEYEEGLEPMEAFQDPDLVNPVPIADAATTPHELKQLQVDLTDLRKSIPNEWETADEVFKNINLFNEWLPRTQWNYNPRAKIYLMFNTLPRNLKKQLIKVGWTKRCADQDTTRGSLQAMQNWILSWRHVRPKGETALRALYTQELRQGPKEQLRTWYEKIQEVGEDAYGHNKYLWSLPQRRIVAQAFIVGCRYNKPTGTSSRTPWRGWTRGSSTSTWIIAGMSSRRARCVRTNTLMSPSSGKQNVIRQRPQQRPQPGPTIPRTGCQWTRRETPRIGCRSRRWPEPGKRGFPSGATTVGRRDTQSDSAQILMCQVSCLLYTSPSPRD